MFRCSTTPVALLAAGRAIFTDSSMRCLSTSSRLTRTTSGDDKAQTLTLSDGRSLGFATYGSPAGVPIFFFHGLPSSRLEAAEWHEPASKFGACMIGVDRPGMGLSTFQFNRKVLDWPGDVSQLAQHLGFSRYRVLGSSGGCSYTLACAKVLPKEKLLGVGVVAGMGPWDLARKLLSTPRTMAFILASWSPAAVRWYYDRRVTAAARNPDYEVFAKKLTRALNWLTGPDRAILKNERVLQMTIDAMRESFQQGARGYAEEIGLITSPWGFALEDVEFDKVKLWYGTEDVHTPIELGRQMAKRLPNADFNEYLGEAHFSITMNHGEEILRDMLSSD